jgi:hypothetical protein
VRAVPKKSRYQDDDLTFDRVLERVEPWLRAQLGELDRPLVQIVSQHLAAVDCPPQCPICGICHVVMHCHLAQQHEVSYGLAEYLTATRDQLDGIRAQLALAYGRYRRALLRERRRALQPAETTDDTVLSGETEGQKAGRLLGAAVEALNLAKEEILGRTITPNLASPAAVRRPAHLRTVVEAYLARDAWPAAEVHQLLERKPPTTLELKRMYARATEAKVRGDLVLLDLRQSGKTRVPA